MINPQQISPETALQIAQMQQAKQIQAQQGMQGYMPQQSPWSQMNQDPNIGPMVADNSASPSPRPSPSAAPEGLWEMVQELVQNPNQKKVEAAKKKPVKPNTGSEVSGGFNRASGMGSAFKK